MVSKIAVMALVAVVAVPILLGYGLNINTEDRQVWTENDDPLNAKDYLQTTFDATGITYTDADFYQMNSNIFYRQSYGSPLQHLKFYPWYQQVGTVKTPIAISQILRGQTDYNLPNDSSFTNGQVFVTGEYDASNYYNIIFYTGGAPSGTISHLDNVVFVGTTAHYQYRNSSNALISGTHLNAENSRIWSVGDPTSYLSFSYVPTPNYADPAAGYRLNLDGAKWTDVNSSSGVKYTLLEISKTTKSMLMTFDLSTITDSDAIFRITSTLGDIYFKKTTTGGTVKWEYTAYVPNGTPMDFQEMYYNPLASSNTYQIYVNADYTGELRYIGSWPDMIGPATPFITTPFDIWHNPLLPASEHISDMNIKGQTPVMRIDAARVGAYDYRVMEDAVYDPAVFRANPITTLTNGLRFGSSLEFGGNTYTVTKGNITIGTHDFSLEGMTFESVQVGGQYENRINGNTVSTTAAPSTITFNGKWLTDVTTESQAMTTVSETKWEPGKFAWDGIDTDFKLAGLMASLGAFIGLAIYGRRSGTKVMPLLVVCGGAALMFLVMI